MDTYNQIGSSGLFTWKVGLGTMQFGWTVDEPGSFEILDAYAEAGGNFVDTADVYSAWAGNEGGEPQPGGVSEEIIGRWMASRRNRDDLIVATKVRGAMGESFSEGRGTVHQREGLGRGWIMRACEDSLRRLQVDHIDLYQVHWIDPLVPIEETLGALTDLVRQGKVRYLGCSNFSAWRIMESLWTSDRRGLERFISLQPEYNLLAPTRGEVERELAPMCQRYGIGMVPYSPLAAGMLTGKYRRDEGLPESVRADSNRAKWISEQNWDVIETLVEVAEGHGISPASAAIQWQRAKPWVASPIIGANRPSQLADTLSGLDAPLSADAMARLDEVSDFHRPRYVREA
ncbi:aldo/keto reductase [Euzebya tangerina]|uniref:aldo/keto reductase n=1 Tax=Euzebya tangerina TaxID=591198 RepID=UPI000E313C8F|nr:aldo/keto reductase [Euzebya tangerina]